MAAIIPPFDVDDPTPQVRRYGLFSAATGPLDLPVLARAGGVRYQSALMDLPEGFEVTCASSAISFPDDCGDLVTGTPFTVQATLTGGSLGLPEALVNERLLRRLRGGEQAIVEQVFSDGLFGAAPSLSNNATPAPSLPASSSILGGVAALESWLAARSGLVGTIHIPMSCASVLVATGALTMGPDRVWRTAVGSAVSFGAYSGKTPAGAVPPAGHTTLYVTGSTVLWRTPDEQLEFIPYRAMLNPSTNQINAFVRREYVVTHNGLLAAVDVTIGGE